MATIVIPANQDLSEGDEMVVVAKDVVKGEQVEIVRMINSDYYTRAIAVGICIMEMADDPQAPITPTQAGEPDRNAWIPYKKIRVERILE